MQAAGVPAGLCSEVLLMDAKAILGYPSTQSAAASPPPAATAAAASGSSAASAFLWWPIIAAIAGVVGVVVFAAFAIAAALKRRNNQNRVAAAPTTPSTPSSPATVHTAPAANPDEPAALANPASPPATAATEQLPPQQQQATGATGAAGTTASAQASPDRAGWFADPLPHPTTDPPIPAGASVEALSGPAMVTAAGGPMESEPSAGSDANLKGKGGNKRKKPGVQATPVLEPSPRVSLVAGMPLPNLPGQVQQGPAVHSEEDLGMGNYTGSRRKRLSWVVGE